MMISIYFVLRNLFLLLVQSALLSVPIYYLFQAIGLPVPIEQVGALFFSGTLLLRAEPLVWWVEGRRIAAIKRVVQAAAYAEGKTFSEKATEIDEELDRKIKDLEDKDDNSKGF